MRFVACAASLATWLLFTGVIAWCVALRVRSPWPLGACLPSCSLCAFCSVCGVLGHLAPVHRCAHLVRCVVFAVSWVSWLLFAGVLARCVAFCVRCPWQLGSCSLLDPLDVLCCVYGVLGYLASVDQCARSVRRVACVVSWATALLFTGVPALCVVMGRRCPGRLARCAVLCVVCEVSWAIGFCSPMCPLGASFSVCGVPGLLVPVRRCARSVRCVACASSWAT